MFWKRVGLTLLVGLPLAADPFGKDQVFLHNRSNKACSVQTLMRSGPADVLSIPADGVPRWRNQDDSQAFMGEIDPGEILIFQAKTERGFFSQVLAVNSGTPDSNTYLSHLWGGPALARQPEGWSVRGGTAPDAPAGVVRVRVLTPRFAQITPFPEGFEKTEPGGGGHAEAATGGQQETQETKEPRSELKSAATWEDLVGAGQAAAPPVKLRSRRLGELAERGDGSKPG